MYDIKVKMGGRVFTISSIHPNVGYVCKKYEAEGEPDFHIAITQSDIDFERAKSEREDALEGRTPYPYKDCYLETLAVYRQIAENMLNYDTLLFHGSTIGVDGEAYTFTAKSGTGKSTHTRLWKKAFGDRMIMINDDKPLFQITEEGVIAHGTPWAGKHFLHTNTAMPLKAICLLERAEHNHIEPLSAKDALPLLMQQTYRPQDPAGIFKVLQLLDKMTQKTGLYRLGCNMDPEAALVAYHGMNRKD